MENQYVDAHNVQIGVVYYPEHWDPSLWEEDIQLMKQTGVQVVRLAEFAWSRMEPSPGRYTFEWLDQALDLFAKYQIRVVLCTPTNTPPRWLSEMKPDILPVFANGGTHHPGVRGHRCYNSESLRDYGARIITQMTARYGDHPAVIGWQLDNEYWVIDCHCDTCNQRFREWVQEKYGTLENVNREWGTVVWSGEYSDWSQVGVPYGGSRHQNPSYLLDFARFQWDCIADFQREQIRVIRANCPGHWVTHNFHTYPQRLNLYQVGADLDVAAFDYYPNTAPDKQATGPYSGALSLDVTRGIKRRNFWIMEQLSGPPGCWFPTWRAPYPGFIRAFSWQAIARGADTVVHFRWRSAVAGAEQFWHGLIDQSNVPGRRFREFAELCGEVNALADKLQGTALVNEAAILLSHEHLEALRIQPQAEGYDYYENVKDYHRALTKLGIGCDVIEWTQALDGYKLVVAPSFYLLNEEVTTALERFAAAGGTVVVTSRSGVKHMNNQHVMLPLPGLLANCTGVNVEEYDAIGRTAMRVVDGEGRSYQGSQWCDVLSLHGAKAVLWYDEEFYKGTPAATVNRFGQGKVYYLGTHLDEVCLMRLFREIAEELGLMVMPDLPEGVQIAIRTGTTGSYLFVLNLSRDPQQVMMPDAYPSLLYETERGNVLSLAPYGVDILQLS
ncbi:beta-galactosidase [Paenibacillus medicaginis]|uniref:Beta-galactosidase n=1 Tax=Paenibacillus medicaginis TaxID=1470560 RepID=A0ABV5C3V9_9BACL